MKPTHLITLSKYVDSAQKSTHNVGLGTLFTHVREYNDLLKKTLCLGQFIAADKDGKPLEKLPKYTYLDDPDQTEKYHEYNEALQGVIFEGWEVVKTIAPNVIRLRNKSLGLCLDFTGHEEIILVNHQTKSRFSFPLYLETIADLAAATTENPLKLK